MHTKLTLRLEHNIIEKIKRYATNHHQSLSKLTEEIYLNLLSQEDPRYRNLSPITKKYAGILKNDSEKYRDKIADYLSRKHK